MLEFRLESLRSFLNRFNGEKILVTLKTWAKVGGLATPVILKSATLEKSVADDEIGRVESPLDHFEKLVELDIDAVFIDQWNVEMVDDKDGNMVPCLSVFIQDIPDRVAKPSTDTHVKPIMNRKLK